MTPITILVTGCAVTFGISFGSVRTIQALQPAPAVTEHPVILPLPPYMIEGTGYRAGALRPTTGRSTPARM